MPLTTYPIEMLPVVGEPEEDYAVHAQFLAEFVQNLPNEINALADLENASTTCTSSSSNSLTAGDKTFTVLSGLGWASGMAGVAAVTGSSTQYAPFVCKSYAGTTLIVTFGTPVGSGTFTAWTITKANNSSNTASLASNTFTGAQNFAQATDIVAAVTVNLDTATGNTVRVTGNTQINAWTLTNGRQRKVIITGTPLLFYSSTTNNLNTGGENYQCVGGEVLAISSDTGVVRVVISRADGTPIKTKNKLESITVTQASGAITITVNPCVADFRNSTLTTGTPVTRQITSAKTTTISNGSTGGVTSGQSGRIAVLIVDNGTDFDVAWVNIAGGVQLDETNLISTIAEGGAGAADSGSVIYSTSALSSRPYRVWGFFDAVNTGGAWSNPTKVQPAGGVASTLAAMGVEGDAPIFPARAWVNFNGTGTLAIRGSRNVLSVTDNGAGDYTVNFSSQMPDTNYAVAMSAGLSTTGAANTPILPTFSGSGTTPKTTSAVRVWCKQAGTLVDADFVDVTVFR